MEEQHTLKNKKRQRFTFKLPFDAKSHHKLILLNKDTLEEAFSWDLKPMNVFIVVGISAICLIVLTAMLMAFTPLREYIPGYKDPRLDRKVYELSMKVDSLYQATQEKDRYLYIVQSLYNGDNIELVKHVSTIDSVDYTEIKDRRSEADSLFRLEIENEDKSVVESQSKRFISEYNNLFLQPVRGGLLVNNFDKNKNQFDVQFIVNKDTPVLSIADGTVIYAGWSVEFGHVITVMHRNNFVSVYKNVDALMKKRGDYVKVGDVIAVVGGENDGNNKINFELWRNGVAVNPTDFMRIE